MKPLVRVLSPTVGKSDARLNLLDQLNSGHHQTTSIALAGHNHVHPTMPRLYPAKQQYASSPNFRIKPLGMILSPLAVPARPHTCNQFSGAGGEWRGRRGNAGQLWAVERLCWAIIWSAGQQGGHQGTRTTSVSMGTVSCLSGATGIK